jgi:hypothetical protein
LQEGARNSELPEFPQNFRGPEIPEFLALQIFTKSFLSSCGATFSKGPEFLAGIFRNENFWGAGISAPRPEFLPSVKPQNFCPQAGISGVGRLQRTDFELAYK